MFLVHFAWFIAYQRNAAWVAFDSSRKVAPSAVLTARPLWSSWMSESRVWAERGVGTGVSLIAALSWVVVVGAALFGATHHDGQQ
jgi:hypothetical protein